MDGNSHKKEQNAWVKQGSSYLIIFMTKSKLTLVKEKAKRHPKRGSWMNKYKCECGSTTFQYAHNVKSGFVKSCGCLHIRNTPPYNSMLTFICKTKMRVYGKVYNKYKCECGKIVIRLGVGVRNGSIKSCGCLKENYVPSNKKYFIQPEDSKLTLIKENVKKKGGEWLSRYECECGKIKLVRKSHVLSGSIKSCGCLRLLCHGNKKHGMEGTRIYSIWVSMRRRCRDKKGYADRGIRVCELWEKSFIPFHKWSMENGYTDKLQIDRINNDGNYEPSNCRWTTVKINSNNRRSNLGVKKIREIKSILSKGFSPAQVKEILGYGAVSHIRNIRDGKIHSEIN